METGVDELSADALLGWAAAVTGSARRQQQRDGIDTQAFGDAFDASEGQVAFPALDSAHVSPVEHELVSKRLLAQSQFEAVSAEILPDSHLQLSLHAGNADGPLPNGLQTYEYLRQLISGRKKSFSFLRNAQCSTGDSTYDGVSRSL
jgi:hypothetical protein